MGGRPAEATAVAGAPANVETAMVRELPDAESPAKVPTYAAPVNAEAASVEDEDIEEGGNQKKQVASVDAYSQIMQDMDTAQKHEDQIKQLKQSIATEKALLKQSQDLATSFQDDESSNSVMVQVQQTKDMLDRNEKLLEMAQNDALEAARDALNGAQAAQQAANDVEKKLQAAKDEIKKAADLTSKAEAEFTKVEAATKDEAPGKAEADE